MNSIYLYIFFLFLTSTIIGQEHDLLVRENQELRTLLQQSNLGIATLLSQNQELMSVWERSQSMMTWMRSELEKYDDAYKKLLLHSLKQAKKEFELSSLNRTLEKENHKLEAEISDCKQAKSEYVINVKELEEQNETLEKESLRSRDEKKKLLECFEEEINKIESFAIQRHDQSSRAIAELSKEIAPLRQSISPLRRQLADKDAEIAKLTQALIKIQLDKVT